MESMESCLYSASLDEIPVEREEWLSIDVETEDKLVRVVCLELFEPRCDRGNEGFNGEARDSTEGSAFAEGCFFFSWRWVVVL